MGLLRSALIGTAGLVCVGWIGSGCGARASADSVFVEKCTPGRATCLSAQLGQICNEQGQWATFQCDSEETCTDGLCVAACSANLHECLTSTLQRICLGDALGWVTTECPAGFDCVDGECLGSCEPGATLCAARQVVRECRNDGAGYLEQQCPSGMSCQEGACVRDTSATCTFGQDVCADDTTALICKSDGSGYQMKTCTLGTHCRTGKCMGPVCAAGATTCTSSSVADFTGVQTCAEDGTGYTVSVCRSSERCVVNKDRGQSECYLPPCSQNEAICGDATGLRSATDRVSRCETLGNGKLAWVTYLCSAPASCTVSERGVTACHADCAPGDRRCSTEGDAIESCGEDGKWTEQSCDPSGSGMQQCVLVPTTKKVVCGDPDCRTLQSSTQNYKTRGPCSESRIRLCGEDGKLSSASDCEEGVCLVESDGFGTCKDPTRCNQEDGWRECTSQDDAYRTCLGGHWEFTLCAAEETCSDDGQGKAVCGDQCYPGDLRCDGTGYRSCSESGTWGPTLRCPQGECNPVTKRCETACERGQIRCAGDVVAAPDASSLGSTGVETCQTDGSWGPLRECEGTRRCRRSGNGVHLGCVECVGASVPGGNEEGAIDSRCTEDGNGYEVCQEDNAWPEQATDCAPTEYCLKQRDGTIRGTCSDDGCLATTSRRCLGYETLDESIVIDDCCAGECDMEAGECRRRRAQYDPLCVNAASCFSGYYDTSGEVINESCCSGFCRSGGGCLKIKSAPCDAVTTCAVKKVGHASVCCGSCQADGTCAEGGEAEHPEGEYFQCGTSSSLCRGIGSCLWAASGTGSGAMFANCVEKPAAE